MIQYIVRRVTFWVVAINYPVLGRNEVLMQRLVNWAKSPFSLLALCVIGTQAFAQTQEISVKLQTLEAVHPQEKRGDELYISVTEFPTQSNPRHYQVPSYPSHWLSKYASSIKDVVIWKKDLEGCEPVDLLITLVEEDFAPWNIDDTLGSVELKVKCVNGKAEEEWMIPDAKTTVKIKSEPNTTFQFKGENAEYHAVFKLERNNGKNVKKDQSKTENKSEVPLNTLIP